MDQVLHHSDGLVETEQGEVTCSPRRHDRMKNGESDLPGYAAQRGSPSKSRSLGSLCPRLKLALFAHTAKLAIRSGTSASNTGNPPLCLCNFLAACIRTWGRRSGFVDLATITMSEKPCATAYIPTAAAAASLTHGFVKAHVSKPSACACSASPRSNAQIKLPKNGPD